jgi:hypothetical protein
MREVVSCCVEAECHFHYLGDSGLYMYTKAAAWATVATAATPLPMWGVEGSGMVPLTKDGSWFPLHLLTVRGSYRARGRKEEFEEKGASCRGVREKWSLAPWEASSISLFLLPDANSPGFCCESLPF